MKKSVVLLLFVISLCSLLTMIGCGKTSKNPMEYVEGVVQWNGTPVERALVTFSPTTPNSGEAASGYTNAKGVYKLTSCNGSPEKGALPGEYTVTIVKNESVLLPKPIKEDDGAMITHGSKNILPAPYAKTATTTLTATVKKGANKIDFTLEGK